MKTIINKKRIVLSVALLMIASNTLMGQAEEKEVLTPDKYASWSTLEDLDISSKGSYISYRLRYLEGADTTIVKRIESGHTIKIPNVMIASFTDDKRYAYISLNNEFTWTDLHSATSRSFKNIDRFSLNKKCDVAALFSTQPTGGEALTLVTWAGVEHKVSNIIASTISYEKERIAYASNINGVTTLQVSEFTQHLKPMTIFRSEYLTFDNLTLNNSGEMLAYQTTDFGSHERFLLNAYEISTQKRYGIDLRRVNGWEPGMRLSPLMTVSDDGKKIVVRVSYPETLDETSGLPQIWNAADQTIYSKRKNNNKLKADRIAVWHPHTGNWLWLVEDENKVSTFSGTQNHLFTFNTTAYERETKLNPDRNVYISDLTTGKTDYLFCQYGEQRTLHASKDGHFIFYFKDQGWWSYNIVKDEHFLLTKGLSTEFADVRNDRPHPDPEYGIAGMNHEGTAVFVYDQYDLWELDVEGKKHLRRTDGAKSNTTYRLPDFYSKKQGNSENQLTLPLIDLRQETIFFAQDQSRSLTGYKVRNPNGSWRNIAYKKQHIFGIKKSPLCNNFVFLSENPERPTSLHFAKNYKQSVEVERTNTQHDRYHWGRCERVNYTNGQGQIKEGYLYYPANYDPTRCYSMVVEIYETMSKSYQRYITPTLQSMDGFNKSHYQLQDYFVFFPNITYKIGAVGESALEAVTEALEVILERYPIARDRVGLYGHSFGGYEALYIATQTDKFATIVAGAGVSDLSSFYLSMSYNLRHPQAYRFEHHQWRLGVSLFEDPNRYRDNSPITFAPQVSKPILTWTGLNDTHLDTDQSMEFYLAMRKLKKEHVMLLYPNEGHTLNTPASQIDLSFKIMQWFNHYLKGDAFPIWAQPR